MVEFNKIIDKIEKFAPPELAADWDNSGIQVYFGNKTVNKILLALSPTADVIKQAAEIGCDLIITHHPLIFDKLNCISSENETSRIIILAIRNNIQIYSVHTNLDSAPDGIAEELAKRTGLKNTAIPDYLGEDSRCIRVGEFETEKELDNFIREIKENLNVEKIILINPSGKTKLKTAAVIPGSGGGFIGKIKNIDVLITGDVKYHDALEAKDTVVIDAGHFETERIILPVLKELLSTFDAEIIIAEENPPRRIV